MINAELTVVEEKNVLVAFSQDGGLDPVVEEAKKIVSEFEHDMSTAASRKRTGSLANKVAKLKTRIDGMGKDLVSDWKTKAKAVDASRKSMRDQLDELKVEARKPLTDWEAEEEIRKAAEAAKVAQEKIDAEHETALLMDYKINIEAEEVAQALAKIEEEKAAKAESERIANEKRMAEEAAELAKKVEAERLENEKRIADEAAKQAKIDADKLAKAQLEKVVREKKEAIERAERARAAEEKAKRDAIAAEEREKARAELAEEQRIQAEEKAKKDAIDAAERAREQEVARKQAEDDEARRAAEAREANRAHVGKVRKAIKVALMKYTDEDTAKKITMALHNGELPKASITY